MALVHGDRLIGYFSTLQATALPCAALHVAVHCCVPDARAQCAQGVEEGDAAAFSERGPDYPRSRKYRKSGRAVRGQNQAAVAKASRQRRVAERQCLQKPG